MGLTRSPALTLNTAVNAFARLRPASPEAAEHVLPVGLEVVSVSAVDHPPAGCPSAAAQHLGIAEQHRRIFFVGVGRKTWESVECVGRPFPHVAAHLATTKSTITRCQCFALLDTLEYLQKGGRIGKAQALLGTLLRIRPMIILKEGEVHELGKERTRRKAIARLAQTAREFSPLDRLAVLYSTVRSDAEEVADSLTDLIADGEAPMVVQFGPALGTYVGPNSIGIGLLRSPDDA